MAYQIATADGAWLTGATWGTVDATALLDSEAANTALTTSYVESAGFTPGAITIDGIAVKVATRAVTPSTNTISIRLAQAGVTVPGTEVTINVSDISSRNGEQGWYFFKLAAPVLLVAATVYTVSAKTSAASMVNLYRNATAGNWSRMLRTTTTGAPAGGDSPWILGEWTAAATVTARTVTMDETAATDYGNASTTVPSIGIGKSGTLTWGVTAATNYRLRFSGIFAIYHGGTLNMGTVGAELPRDSTQLFEIDAIAADGDSGIKCWGTWTMQGLSRSSGKNIVKCLLNTDEAAGQTALGVDTDTGWKDTDDVAIAPTTQTASQHETRVLNGDAAASSITVTVGLTNAHSGTSPTQAEVILLTRPIRVESTSTTLMGYVYLGGAAVCNWAWAALRYLGSTTTGKRGLEVDINTGSLTMSYCALRNFDRHGLYTAATDWNHVTISNLTSYAVGANASQDSAIRVSASTASPLDCTLSEIDVIGGGASQGVGIYVFDLGVTITTARLSGGGGSGLRVDAANENQVGIISGITSHSHAEANFRIDDCGVLKMSNLTGYRSASASFGGLYVVAVHKLVINTITLFGNSARNIMWETTGKGRLHILNGTFAGDSTFASARGFQNSANNFVVARFDNCTFGVASGIFVTHSTADINLVATSATARAIDLTLNNVTLASATEVENQASQAGYSAVRYQRVDGATGVHKVEYPALGTVSLDTVTFRTAAPSEKLAPTGASSAVKLESAPRRKRVALGGTVSITAYVRKDGSYNGNAARLVVRANPAIGIDNDTVLDTHTAAADTWEALGGVTPAAEEAGVVEFFVDCDGTAGAIYVDDTAAV